MDPAFSRKMIQKYNKYYWTHPSRHHTQGMEGAHHTDRKRVKSYTPGAPVHAKKRAKTLNATSGGAHGRRCSGDTCANLSLLHEILSDAVVEILARNRASGAITLMSMVNKQFRRSIDTNFAIWYKLYSQWLGPHRSIPRGTIKTPHGTVTLFHTFRSLPNFRDIYRMNA